jgi:regulatory protein YycH of two-component signal transduction system YycFG
LDLSGSFGTGYDFLDGSGSWTSNDISSFFGIGTTASVTFTFTATGHTRTINLVGVNCNI